MSAALQKLVNQPYKHGFVTDIESDVAPKGLNEDTIRLISTKKNEPQWLLEFRLKAYRHWLTMTEPKWPNVKYPKIDFQDIIYYSAPKPRKLASIDEVNARAVEERQAGGVDHDRCVMRLEQSIVRTHFVGVVEGVGKAVTADLFYADAQAYPLAVLRKLRLYSLCRAFS